MIELVTLIPVSPSAQNERREERVTIKSPTPSPGQGPKAPTESEKASAITRLNAHLQRAASNLTFQMDRDSGRAIMKVVNQNTGEVLLQVPPEEALALAKNLQALDKKTNGVLVDREL